MPSCLGMYLEKNMIKYARVSKENDHVKLESYGVRFYDDVKEEISRIIEETYSHTIPIAINISDEMYNYFEVFSLLSKKDIGIAIETEFESMCLEQGNKPNVFESRYILVKGEGETIKAIHISAAKGKIEETIKQFEKYKLNTITPLPTSIVNLIDKTREGNFAILNLEEKTTITIVSNGEIVEIIPFETNVTDILETIDNKVNSYSKAYHICKNTTIYTEHAKELVIEENEYLEDIMPTLYQIVQETTETLKTYQLPIDTVYITGTGAIINNIDLYFSEYAGDMKCELLIPDFVKGFREKQQIDLKEYLEVNSAIAVSMQGLGLGLKQMNYKKGSFLDKLTITKPTFGKKEPKMGKSRLGNFSFDLSGALDGREKNFIRLGVGILLLFVIYAIIGNVVSGRISGQRQKVNDQIAKSNQDISALQVKIDEAKTKTSEYIKLIQKLNNMSEEVSNRYQTINAIPNLLNQIMYIIPKNAKINYLKNVSERNIEIEAEASKYEDLGYLIARMKTDSILLNMTIGTTTKQEGSIKVVIKGELP